MRRRRAPFIPLRNRIFVACEGESEAGYVALLQDFANSSGLWVHLHKEILGPGTGDPLTRINLATERLRTLERKDGPFVGRFAFLDSDQAERNLARAEVARRQATCSNIKIIWQMPCFEAMMLRHLPGMESRQPQSSPLSIQALASEWPEYRKGMARVDLARRIDQDAVQRAARVEADLAVLLRCIGLI
jgi:hypothetical protein